MELARDDRGLMYPHNQLPKALQLQSDDWEDLTSASERAATDVLAGVSVHPNLDLKSGEEVVAALDRAWTKAASKNPFERKQGALELEAIGLFIEKTSKSESRDILLLKNTASVETLEDLYPSGALSTFSQETIDAGFEW